MRHPGIDKVPCSGSSIVISMIPLSIAHARTKLKHVNAMGRILELIPTSNSRYFRAL